MTDLPEAKVGSKDVRIAIAAAGVNRADLLQLAGFYPPPAGAPTGLGLECSGTITELGSQVRGFSVGDSVAALLDGGGYAQSAVAPAGQVLLSGLSFAPPSVVSTGGISVLCGQNESAFLDPAFNGRLTPDNAGLISLAALPEAICTAWSNLVEVGRLQRGETVLIHGGSGGVGTVAVQLAHALGARVATTAGSPERLNRCAELGADILIDYHREDFADAVNRATNGRGVDLILDLIGGPYLNSNINALTVGGRLVVIGLQGGRRCQLDLGRLVSKRISITGTSLRSRSGTEKSRIVGEVAAHVWPLVFGGVIRPVVGAVLPLEQAAKAHSLLDTGTILGKILLLPPPR